MSRAPHSRRQLAAPRPAALRPPQPRDVPAYDVSAYAARGCMAPRRPQPVVGSAQVLPAPQVLAAPPTPCRFRRPAFGGESAMRQPPPSPLWPAGVIPETSRLPPSTLHAWRGGPDTICQRDHADGVHQRPLYLNLTYT